MSNEPSTNNPVANQTVGNDSGNDSEEVSDEDGTKYMENPMSAENLFEIKKDSPLPIMSAYYMRGRMGGWRLKYFNNVITRTMHKMQKFSPTALPVIEVIHQIDNASQKMKLLKIKQGQYLALMNEDKHAQFSIESMRDHADPQIVFYLRELAMYYYNAFIKSGRIHEKLKEQISEREAVPAMIREHNFHPIVSEFERTQIKFYKDAEKIQKKLCKEIFDLITDDVSIENRDQIVRMMMEWKRESSFKNLDPIKGIRNTYLDEYKNIVDSLVEMRHACYTSYQEQARLREFLENAKVLNRKDMSDAGEMVALIHKKVARVVLEEAKTAWEDFENHIDSLFKIQVKIQEAQIETLHLDYLLLQQLVNHANNDQNKFVPEYPRHELDYEMKEKPIFIERTNRKIEEALARISQLEHLKKTGAYEEMKNLAMEKEMEKFEREAQADNENIANLSAILRELTGICEEVFNVYLKEKESDRAAKVAVEEAKAAAEAVKAAREEALKAAKAAKEAKEEEEREKRAVKAAKAKARKQAKKDLAKQETSKEEIFKNETAEEGTIQEETSNKDDS